MARDPKPSGTKPKRARSIASYDRKTGNKLPSQSILIICEGEKTEPIYFNRIKRLYRLSSIQVEIIGDKCDSNPLSVVKYALRTHKKNEKDSIWCVLDVENPADNAKALAVCRRSAGLLQ